MEYELTPSEFVRFLYVIAQRRIKGGAGSGGGSAFQVNGAFSAIFAWFFTVFKV